MIIVLLLVLVVVWVVGFIAVRHYLSSDESPVDRLLNLWDNRRSPWRMRRPK